MPNRTLVALLALACAGMLAPSCVPSPMPPPDRPDVNGDGIVDGLDAVEVSNCFPMAVVAAPCLTSDTDSDGDVDFDDFTIVTSNLGDRIRIDGDLYLAGLPNQLPFQFVGDTLAGSFTLNALTPSDDLRDHPGRVTWLLPDGATLTALPLRRNETRVDPASGRPLAADAPQGATCATGAEPACWAPGGAEAPNRKAFVDICAPTLGQTPLDPAACLLDVFSSPAQLFGLSLAEIFSIAQGGQLAFNTPLHAGFLHDSLGAFTFTTRNALHNHDTLLGGILGRSPFFPDPTLPLGFGVCGPSPNCPWIAGAPSTLTSLNIDPLDGAGAGTNLGAASYLSPEQQALMGCGPFFQTSCDLDGPDYFHSEASLVLSLLHGDAICDRSRKMAGCSGPADPTYNVNQDGSTQGMLDTMTGAPLASEADGIAWNFTQILAASGAGGGPGTLDPNDPLSVSGCSLMNPAACVAAQAFLSASTRELDDDPSGAPARRWLWESGAEFVVTTASGSLSPFQGWTLHAFGPEESRASGGTIGVPFLLVPPEGVTMPPASPLVVISDGTPTPGDETFQGVAYGVAP